jgi:hypothetical protein
MRKIFREPKIRRWDILEKDLVDEMIFRTRNRGTHSLMPRFFAGCNIDNKEATFTNAIFCGLIE